MRRSWGTYPPCPWFTPAQPKSLSRKLPASGVVAVRDEAGRLACAIIASGGFLAAWLAAHDRWRGQQMLRDFAEKTKDRSIDDGAGNGNSAGDRTDPGTSRRHRGRASRPGGHADQG